MAICLTPGCAVAAVELIRDMSPNYKQIDPCQNFQTYACEGFDRSHDLRADQDRIGTLGLMSENAGTVLHQILESPVSELTISSDAAKANFEKIHNAYSSCMNKTQLAAVGNEPLLELIARLEVLYPQINQQFLGPQSQQSLRKPTHASDAITPILQYLLDIDVSALITIGVSSDDKDPDKQIVGLGSPSLGLGPKSYYNDSKMVDPYTDTIAKVFAQLSKSASASDSDFSALKLLTNPNVSALVQFESKIASIKADPDFFRNPDARYNPLSSDEVDKRLPQISISSLIAQHAPGLLPTTIILGEPDYLDLLSELLDETAQETLRTYFTWRIVQSYASYVMSDLSTTLSQFYNKLNGRDVNAQPERWRTCVAQVNSGYSPDSGLGKSAT